jgi:hypothetical protein
MNKQVKYVELFLALSLVTVIGISSNSLVNAEEIDRLPAQTQLLAQGGEGEAVELSPGETANANF